MPTITINHAAPIKERLEAAKNALPYNIRLHELLFYPHDIDDGGYLNERKYIFKLFKFPKGTSKKMAEYRIRRSGGTPANPSHMLAFAEQAFKENKSFGEYHSYVVGLGGEVQTVLGAQFGGLNFGMCYFFQHLRQDKWTHDGGENNRFLAVR